MPENLYYEDLEQGMVFETVSRTIVEDDLLSFARISGDNHPIHVDAAYAAGTEFGQRIAHGPFGIAMGIGLFGTLPQFRETAIVMASIDEWRFVAPMFIGDSFHLRLTIGAKRLTRSGRGMVDRNFELVRGDGFVPQHGRSPMVVLRREDGEA
ncbi:MaoC/PaaZ C-terminal domain-containing protein [Sphingomonas sp. AOB5]|uniref:MaoC/PaaZ C-terminal domain-containing protein n=1 Tax=Sphingomonas sp. AOB5 TaxID=3034017 RepID=UPI0023F973A9|nr:MaoC/PaaZ C-terminal domain-containing protein [Sphingomonas sp. AOB5]MDF7774815.1 MaoC/PaaZ C-terminal domain-containing protein [Sphingomonas sp. AOB5]